MQPDPAADSHITRIVALRAHAWLREQRPGSRLETSLAPLPSGEIACRACVTLANGAQSCAHGVADGAQPGAALVAEDLAVARVMEHFGWSPFVADQPLAVAVADDAGMPTPGERAAAPASDAGGDAAQRGAGRPQLAGKAADLGDPIKRRSGGAPRGGGDGRAVAEPRPTWSTDLADSSWTEFWKWARERGYQRGADIEAIIGRPLGSITPKVARELLQAATATE